MTETRVSRRRTRAQKRKSQGSEPPRKRKKRIENRKIAKKPARSIKKKKRKKSKEVTRVATTSTNKVNKEKKVATKKRSGRKSSRLAKKTKPSIVISPDPEAKEDGHDSDFVVNEEQSVVKCIACNEVGDDNAFILCDYPNAPPHGGHFQCFGLRSIPSGEWFCPKHEDETLDLGESLEEVEEEEDENSDRKPGELRRSKRKRSTVFRFADKMLRDMQWQGVLKKARAKQARKEKREAKKRKDKPKMLAYGDSSGDENSMDEEESDDGAGKQVKPINLTDLGIYDEKAAPEYQAQHMRSDSTAVKISADMDWSHIGGVKGHIQKLKEMILLPLIYPSEFKKFKITPPRGVIFHGPPGTGKTLMARILASEASKHGKQVSFYMRKGADCLSKWIGEAEKELRKVFETALKSSPAIIFFDEIDGLAPVRSSSQDHVHTSIVSTLLALMDGLDDRGHVVVIGATNRIDSLDPALRRPGRFDRELLFSHPSREARESILRIHTRSWDPVLSDTLIGRLAERTPGFCGADLEALCREAFLNCFRRSNPAVYEHTKALKINKNLVIEEGDFLASMRAIIPCSQRSATKFSNPFPDALRPLLDNDYMKKILELQRNTFPLGIITQAQIANLEASTSAFSKTSTQPISPRLLIHGEPGLAQELYAQNLLHELEEFPTFGIDLPSLVKITHTHSLPEALVETMKNARREAPSILYWPQMAKWFEMMGEAMRNCIFQMLSDLPDEVSIYVVATTDQPYEKLDPQLQLLFPGHFAVGLKAPSQKLTRKFWKSVMLDIEARFLTTANEEDLNPIVQIPEPRSPIKQPTPPTEEIFINDQRLSRRQRDLARLRIFLRQVLDHIIKLYPKFAKPMKASKEGVETSQSLRDVRELLNTTKDIDMEHFLDATDEVIHHIQQKCQAALKRSEITDIAKEHIADVCHLQDRILSMVLNADSSLVDRCRRPQKLDISSPSNEKLLPPSLPTRELKESLELDMSPQKLKDILRKDVLKELMQRTKKKTVTDLRELYLKLYSAMMTEKQSSKMVQSLKAVIANI